jgi:hypothetical protein
MIFYCIEIESVLAEFNVMATLIIGIKEHKAVVVVEH